MAKKAAIDDADLVGVVLWAAFKEGVGDKQVPEDVKALAWKRSEAIVRKNMKNGIENFPITRTINCANQTGIEARKRAGKAVTISTQNYNEAFDYVHHRQLKILNRLTKMKGNDLNILGGAC